jgi:hypothetical protein
VCQHHRTAAPEYDKLALEQFAHRFTGVLGLFEDAKLRAEHQAPRSDDQFYLAPDFALPPLHP